MARRDLAHRERILACGALVVVCFLVLPTASQAWEEVSRGAGYRIVRVEAGDTLWTIAAECLGDGKQYGEVWEGILDPDRSSDPNLIFPEMRFRIPDTESRSRAEEETPAIEQSDNGDEESRQDDAEPTALAKKLDTIIGAMEKILDKIPGERGTLQFTIEEAALPIATGAGGSALSAVLFFFAGKIQNSLAQRRRREHYE